MSARVNILEEVLQWPAEERAQLVLDVIRSLDDQTDDDAEALWVAEIERRSAEVAAGTATTMSLDEYRSHMHARRAARSTR